MVMEGEVVALNEPKREKSGAPDYVVSKERDRLAICWVFTPEKRLITAKTLILFAKQPRPESSGLLE